MQKYFSILFLTLGTFSLYGEEVQFDYVPADSLIQAEAKVAAEEAPSAQKEDSVSEQIAETKEEIKADVAAGESEKEQQNETILATPADEKASSTELTVAPAEVQADAATTSQVETVSEAAIATTPADGSQNNLETTASAATIETASTTENSAIQGQIASDYNQNTQMDSTPDTMSQDNMDQSMQTPQEMSSSPTKKKKRFERAMPGFYITGDFLYFNAHEDGLAFAAVGFNDNFFGVVPHTTSVERGRVENFDGEWGPGFRAGLGYTFAGNLWDVYLNWTYYDKDQRDSEESALTSNPLWSEWESVYGDFPISSGKGKWDLNYQTIDLELGRCFTPNKNFSVRPHVGLRGCLIDQKLNINYAFFGNSNINPTNFSTFARNKNDFQGVGFRAGANSGWYFIRHFGLYADVSFSLITGNFKTVNEQRSNIVTDTGIPIPSPYLNQEDHFTSLKPNIQMALGLVWEIPFYHNHYRIQFKAGWEEIYWPGQNQMRRYDLNGPAQSITDKGDLSLHGFSFSGMLNF